MEIRRIICYNKNRILRKIRWREKGEKMGLYEGIKDVAKVVQEADNNFTKKTHNWKSEKNLKKLLLGTRSLLLQEVTTPFKYTIALTVGTTKAVCSKLVAQRTERLFVRIATHLVSMTAKRNEHIIAKLMISNFDFEVELGKQITMIYGCRNTNITRPESTKMKENC